MSPPDDYVDDMPNEMLTDAAIEAFFLGSADPDWEREASLATLADDMAIVMSGPAPVADHALLQLFWGAPAPAESPSPGIVATDERRAPVGAFRRRARLIVGVATGAALAVVSVGAAGATGVLPDPAQRFVAQVVEAISPLELPDPTDPTDPTDLPGGRLPSPQETSSTVDQQPPANGPEAPSGYVDATPNSAPPADPGATGLETAGQTPADQYIPPFVHGAGTPSNPGPSNSDTAPAGGLDTARQTPAATAVPASIPEPPAAGPASNRRR